MRSTSTASALSGDTYSTWVPAGRSGLAAPARLSSAHRNAARVLPEPVGAMTSVLSPLAIAVQAAACAVVGAAKVLANQSRVIALNRASACGAEMLTSPIVPTGTDNYTCGWKRAVAMALAS